MSPPTGLVSVVCNFVTLLLEDTYHLTPLGDGTVPFKGAITTIWAAAAQHLWLWTPLMQSRLVMDLRHHRKMD